MSFGLECFKNCDLDDPFFDSLKEDYDEFETWFRRKMAENEKAYIHKIDSSIQAFLYIKDWEEEPVGDLPAEPRIKIGTMKICKDSKGRRLGEGAMGIALWTWQQSDLNEIYVTVYPKHDDLISILKSYGFQYAGPEGQEDVYVKDKRKIDYSDPKKSFPYISPDFRRGRYIPINEGYHDKMFQYSELKGVPQARSELSVSNGITKAYISNGKPSYSNGDIVFMYRIHTGPEPKIYKSAVTSFCTVTKIISVKEYGKVLKRYEEFCDIVGNKTVYSEDQLKESFSKPNLYVIEMVYNGYFGAGKNVNLAKLQDEGLWGKEYPGNHILSRDQTIALLKMGGKDVRDVIID